MSQELPRQFRKILDETPAAIREDWQAFTVDTVINGVWARTEYLSLRERRIVSLSILLALNMPHEFALHLRQAIAQGFTSREIGELIMHAAVYAGFPRAVEAMRIAGEVIAEREAVDGDSST